MGIIVSLLSYANDASIVKHHMLNGGCAQEFAVAVSQCHRDMIKRRADLAKPVVDAEACARATAVLRKCLGRNANGSSTNTSPAWTTASTRTSTVAGAGGEGE